MIKQSGDIEADSRLCAFWIFANQLKLDHHHHHSTPNLIQIKPTKIH
jgi:hypothetical protein